MKEGDEIFQVYKHQNGTWKVRKGTVMYMHIRKRLGVLYEDDQGLFRVHKHTGAMYFDRIGEWFRTVPEAVTAALLKERHRFEKEMEKVAGLLEAELESTQDTENPGEEKCSAPPPANSL